MKSFFRSLLCAAQGLALVIAVGQAEILLAEASDDTSEVDVIAVETAPAPVAPEQPATEPATAKPEPVPAATPANPVRLPPKVSSSAPAAMQIEALSESLRQRDKELAEARQEVARLKVLMKKMLDANRRERLAMHYNMGCAFRAGRDFKRAEIEFTRALELDPDDPGAHYNMAILYDDDLKDQKKAKIHYEKFLNLAPDDKDAPKVREWLSSITMKVPEDK